MPMLLFVSPWIIHAHMRTQKILPPLPVKSQSEIYGRVNDLARDLLRTRAGDPSKGDIFKDLADLVPPEHTDQKKTLIR